MVHTGIMSNPRALRGVGANANEMAWNLLLGSDTEFGQVSKSEFNARIHAAITPSAALDIALRGDGQSIEPQFR